MKLWNAQTGDLLLDFSKHESEVRGVAFHPDGQRIVSVGGQKLTTEVKLWQASTGEVVYARRGHSDVTENVMVSPDGRCFVSVSGWAGTAR